MKTITLEWLRQQRACSSATTRFARLFGQSAEVSVANARRWLDSSDWERDSWGLKTDLLWLAIRLVARFKGGNPWTWPPRSLPLAAAVLRHLDIAPARDIPVFESVTGALRRLSDTRLLRAIEQIAARSPNL